jgi:hypothetical protein
MSPGEQHPDSLVLTMSAARSGLVAPEICPGCGNEDSLAAVHKSWVLNQVTAIAAAVAAVAFPLVLTSGRAIHMLLHHGSLDFETGRRSQWLIPLLAGFWVAVYFMAARRFSVTYRICRRCVTEQQSPARLLAPAGATMGLGVAGFGLFTAVAVIVVNDLGLVASMGIGLGIGLVSGAILWLSVKALRWFLRGRPLFVKGDAYSVRLHAASPVFISRLRDQLAQPAESAARGLEPAPATGVLRRYALLRGLTRGVVVLLAADTAIILVAIAATAFQVRMLLQRTVDMIPAALLTANDQRQKLIGFAGLATFAVVSAVFLLWFYRARRNLESLGTRGLRVSPSRAVVSWLIPLENLYLPFQIMQETWKASVSQPDPEGDAWRHARMTVLLTPWWLLFLLSGVLGILTFSLYRDVNVFADSSYALTSGLLAASYVDLSAGLARAASNVLLMLIVRGISRNQDEKWQRLRGS